MAFRANIMKNHNKISNNILRYFPNQSIFGKNVRFISETPKQTILKKKLPKNITLWQCSQSTTSSQANGLVGQERRPLALIFSWMFSQDKHLEKFRNLWFGKGFDVITIQTSLADAMLPPFGSQVVAKKLVKTLSELSPIYDEIVVHSFSVGGYQYGEVLVELNKEDRHKPVMKSIKGVIMDSLVYAKDAAPGVSRTVTQNKLLQPIVEITTDLFVKLFQRLIIKHFNNSEDMVAWHPPLKYPGLILYSRDDLISSFNSNESLVKSWQKCGNSIRAKCWDHSPHVLHYKLHQKEYEQELDQFVQSLKLRNCRIK